MKKLTKYDLLNMVDSAQIKLSECIDLLEKFNKIANDGAVDSYIITQLKIILNNRHGYLSRDINLEEVKQNINYDEYVDNIEKYNKKLTKK